MDNHLKLIVEALLFASDEPLSPRQIRDLLPGKDLKDIKKVLKELKDEYETMKRSFLIKEVAEGYQFRSLPKFKPALETLTIIAYKQPIIRQEIERLRGVEVGGILKMLLKKGLARIVGRKPLPGRPIIYGTTKKFLEVFDLKDLSSLPTLKEIQELGDGEEEG
jgi:segregation and condensation protein B